jgi:integrase
LTLDGFADLYRKAIEMVEFPPSKPTAERYIKSLFLIGRLVHARKVEDLTPEKIEKFRADYLVEARKAGRDENSIKTTINFHLRNAGALFSRQVTPAFQNQGLTVANPFAGKKLRRVEIKAYSPLKRELLDRIWQDAAKLRDGDPTAPEPGSVKARRWQDPDFREPHPDGYAILLLELGLGFRRHEADKAEWDWFHTINGRHYIEVRETPYFRPKARERRVIPVEPLLYEAIQGTRTHAGAWIVPGPAPKRYAPGKEPKNIVYRCDKAHRVLAAWLRARGIGDAKPCHLLRREFGSYVATAFGLFHAQRMLGHSSPEVTSAYYAGLTELPELRHAKLS